MRSIGGPLPTETVKKLNDMVGLKYKEVTEFMGKFHEEHPELQKATELSKKVIRNTFKIKDKAKLEILSGAVGMTTWVKSKGGKRDVTQTVKTTLQDIKCQHLWNLHLGNLLQLP